MDRSCAPTSPGEGEGGGGRGRTIRRREKRGRLSDHSYQRAAATIGIASNDTKPPASKMCCNVSVGIDCDTPSLDHGGLGLAGQIGTGTDLWAFTCNSSRRTRYWSQGHFGEGEGKRTDESN